MAKVGKPLYYKTPEEMQLKIDEYFTDCEEKENIPTIEGMALYLGFEDRHSISNYGNRDKYCATIKKARTKLMEIQKQLAMKNKMNPTIFIFNAKNNYQYQDKQQLEHSVDSEAYDKLKNLYGN